MQSKKVKVLIIDDQKEILDLVADTLGNKEFAVTKANNGRDGFRTAKSELPDIILLDIVMPGYDGITTCKTLKRDPATKKIPVLFLTAHHSDEDVKNARIAGGDDYIVKPFDREKLIGRLRHWYPKS